MSLVTEITADFITPSSQGPTYSSARPQSVKVDMPGTSLRVVQVNAKVPRINNSYDYVGLPEAGIIFQTPVKVTPVSPVEQPPYEYFPVSVIGPTGGVTQYYLPLYYDIDNA